MSGRIFLDTNIVVYLFDTDSPIKQRRAREILSGGDRGRIIISTQVLEEFYVCVTRKLAEPLDAKVAYRAVKDLAALFVLQIDVAMIISAISRSQRDQLSFWDSLIIEAAIVGGATILYSEDLQHGRRIENIRIENPFL